MLALRIQFDQCLDPQAALAAVRLKLSNAALRLQGDRLMITTARDHSFRFGRHWSCDVFLLDADAFAGGVGKEHLQIEIISNRCFARDLATRNGTQINGKWLGGPPDRRRGGANRTPSGRRELKAGDVLRLPGVTFTVIEASLDVSSIPPGPAGLDAAASSAPPPLPALPGFTSAPSPDAPPVFDGFRFAATLGGRPATGLTYLYERVDGSGSGGEKRVVKFVGFQSPPERGALRQLISRYQDVVSSVLVLPNALSFLPDDRPTHLALGYPYLPISNLAQTPLPNLAAVYDVMNGVLAGLVGVHQHGLTHGHLCAGNIFLKADGQVVLTDCGWNQIRSMIGAELSGPPPSATNDLSALGSLCLDLLGGTGVVDRRPAVLKVPPPEPSWPGWPLQELAGRLRQDGTFTASRALQGLRNTPRPKVNRLVTVLR
jgi:hypothetical protein